MVLLLPSLRLPIRSSLSLFLQRVVSCLSLLHCCLHLSLYDSLHLRRCFAAKTSQFFQLTPLCLWGCVHTAAGCCRALNPEVAWCRSLHSGSFIRLQCVVPAPWPRAPKALRSKAFEFLPIGIKVC